MLGETVPETQPNSPESTPDIDSSSDSRTSAQRSKSIMSSSAPKQWCLSETETLSSFESWKENLLYRLSLETNLTTYLVANYAWSKKSSTTTRDAPLELMLGQIANFAPVISRAEITKRATSLSDIWQKIRTYYGFQTSGSHFLDLSDIKYNPEKRYEFLYQEIQSFVEDSLLQTGGSITHHGQAVGTDEELTPTVENFIVLTWLQKINPGLVGIVKQRYATELRTRTLASIKQEISQALPALVEEMETTKVMRAGIQSPPQRNPASGYNSRQPRPAAAGKASYQCEVCKLAGRKPIDHPLSSCRFLPQADQLYFKKLKARYILTVNAEDEESLNMDNLDLDISDGECRNQTTTPSVVYRVSRRSSPVLPVFYNGQKLLLTLDCGAETTLFDEKIVLSLGITIQATTCRAFQADGQTALCVVGEAKLDVCHGAHHLKLDGLVIRGLDVPVLAGQPFLESNDITIRPSQKLIKIGDNYSYTYNNFGNCNPSSNSRSYSSTSTCNPSSEPESSLKIRGVVLRCPEHTILWPGQSIEIPISSEFEESADIAIQPVTPRHELVDAHYSWPEPHIVSSRCGKISIPNSSPCPIRLLKHEHLGVALPTQSTPPLGNQESVPPPTRTVEPTSSFTEIQTDPDNILLSPWVQKFKSLHAKHSPVFDGQLVGYNGAMGNIQAEVNMGPTQPPQHKGKVPQYNHRNLQTLQDTFDNLETKGIFAKPEDIGIQVEYVNPSFLVSQKGKSARLVTNFSEVGHYSKPQPSRMSNTSHALQRIGTWRYLIKSDLTKAYFQLPLSRESIKYCGVVTPFRGLRVYVRAAMGMPGSETALEELLYRIFGDLLKEGSMVKVADDIFIGSNSLEHLYETWQTVLELCRKCDLRLSASKTAICPAKTTVLGWIWNSGRLSASTHLISTLVSCTMPEDVKSMRSYIGTYKVLARVIPNTAQILAPLEDVCAGQDTKAKIPPTEDLLEHFRKSQEIIRSPNTLTCPKPEDELWIVTDGSTSKYGLGATLYVVRNNQLHLAGFFSAKLKQHQKTWIPCELEALGIAVSVKHFSPFIIESSKKAHVLTDSKPCVQAYEKLRRGEFSNSPRLTTFLSVASQYQVTVAHLAGSANLPSDFASRNASPCTETRCQICSFVRQLETASVMQVSIEDILDGKSPVPFANRASWKSTQLQCPDTRRAHAHLQQGTRPGKKATKLKDVKRYLQAAVISDGLLVVKKEDPLCPPRDCIVVPRQVVEGLLTAIHLRLKHPTKLQLKRTFSRCFYALDADRYIDKVTESCHTCASLKKLPQIVLEQSSSPPPTAAGTSFAADVFKLPRQSILLLRETVTSYTVACSVENEREGTMCAGLTQLICGLRPADGPPGYIRVDPGPGFVAVQNRNRLQSQNISLVIGNPKNPNKNPVAEKSVDEMRSEIKRIYPNQTFLEPHQLATVCQRLNSRIRSSGLSAYEMFFHRNQYTNELIPIDDLALITQQHERRAKNHISSENSKSRSGVRMPTPDIQRGDIVYLYGDSSKLISRPRYLVLSVSPPKCEIRKFTSEQFRGKSYHVPMNACYLVPTSSLLETDTFTGREYPLGLDDDVINRDNVDILEEFDPSVSSPPAPELLTRPQSHSPQRPPRVNDSTPIISEMDASNASLDRPQRNRRKNVRLKDYVVYRSW